MRANWVTRDFRLDRDSIRVQVPAPSGALRAGAERSAPPRPSGTPPRRPGRFWVTFAAAHALLAVAIELATHGTAAVAWDPFPTWGHALAALAAPVLLLVAETLVRRPDSRPSHLRRAALANGFALAVGFAYVVAFVPAVPLFAIGTLFFGLGLLGFGPWSLTLAALAQGRRIRAALPAVVGAGPAPARLALIGGVRDLRRARIRGALAALLLLAAFELPRLLAVLGARLASYDEPIATAAGLWILRHGASEARLAELAAPAMREDGPAFAPRSPWTPTLDPRRVAELTWTATGRPAWSHPPRGGVALMALFAGLEGSRSFAGDVLTSATGLAPGTFRAPGLSLGESHHDLWISTATGSALVDWVITFRNASPVQQDAAAEIELPPGGAATRLTLWIDGEEREAAYGPANRVRAAYRAVTARRLDPALLTWAAPGRLALRASPVPAGGEMKLKVGITAPLVERDGRVEVVLPRFVERNFLVTPKLASALRIESDVAVHGARNARLTEHQAADGTFEGLVRIPSATFAGADPASRRLRLEGAAVASGAPARVPFGGSALEARLVPVVSDATAPTVLVIDGSASMRDADLDWERIVAALPPESAIGAVVSGDEAQSWRDELVPADPKRRADLVDWLEDLDFESGRNPTSAFERALSLTRGSARARILWIHGPVPVESGLVDRLRPMTARARALPRIVDFPVFPGPDRSLPRPLPSGVTIDVYPRVGEVSADLARLVGRGWPSDRRLTIQPAPAELSAPDAPRALARLASARWAEDLHQHGRVVSDATVKELVDHRVVTPASGAVVLETAAQYREHGLDPARMPDSGDMPSVPEPATVALLCVAGAAGARAWQRRRRSC